MTTYMSARGWEYSLIWPIRERANGQGMVFGPSVLNTVYNFTWVCPTQGLNLEGMVAWLLSRHVQVKSRQVNFI